MMLEVPEELNGMVAALRDVGDRFPGVDYFEDDLSQSFDETPDFSRFFVDMLREDIRRREEGIWQLPRWATSAIRIIGPLVLDFVPFVSQAMTAYELWQSAEAGDGLGILAAGAGFVPGLKSAKKGLKLLKHGDEVADAVVHGNSLLSKNPQHVYELLRTDAAGRTEVFKYGISGGKLSAAEVSMRAERQVRAHNRASGGAVRLRVVDRRNDPRRRGCKGSGVGPGKGTSV